MRRDRGRVGVHAAGEPVELAVDDEDSTGSVGEDRVVSSGLPLAWGGTTTSEHRILVEASRNTRGFTGDIGENPSKQLDCVRRRCVATGPATKSRREYAMRDRAEAPLGERTGAAEGNKWNWTFRRTV